MEKINWIQLGLGFLSGGAFGALIKQFFDNRRNRLQPIAKSVEIKPFYDSSNNEIFNSSIVLSDGSDDYKFERIFICSIKIINSGLHDFEKFSFGITGAKDAKFISIKGNSKDRHHQINFSNKPSLNNQIENFDVSLLPFNRKDYYSFDLLVTTSEIDINPKNIKISCPHAIKWVDISSLGKSLLEITGEFIGSSASITFRI
ncbi:hypothetical protein ACLI09_11985 [Flavobacterium sp. RHBU_24]|uniref:hypothetical protein n=1 Tax=Flavobacterium sp. RHBU_24 TaxID=3391185 RepID=UPI003984E16E